MLSRVGISLEENLLEQFDKLVEERGYANRSEAIRDLLREEIVRSEWQNADEDENRVAVVTLVFDHEERELGQKLTEKQHAGHDIVVSSMHVHMDRHNCLEVIVLRGKGSELIKLSNTLIASRGVKLGKVVFASLGENL